MFGVIEIMMLLLSLFTILNFRRVLSCSLCLLDRGLSSKVSLILTLIARGWLMIISLPDEGGLDLRLSVIVAHSRGQRG